jgi:hypothetical protein
MLSTSKSVIGWATVAASVSVVAAGLTFSAPSAWRVVPTSSSMRVAQYALPRAPGDTQDAELVIYYFGGSGGSVDANIQRWVGQMQQPDGRPSSAVAKHSKRTVNGLAATVVDVSGTYVAEMTPGSQERHNSPNFRLRAVVIETANGPYFIKLTGPVATVSAHEKNFEQFLGSVKYQP